MKVLIADDSDILRRRIADLLSDLKGVQIYQARDGLEAIRLSRLIAQDVVVLDIRMPGKNGLEVLKTIKSEPDPPTVIVFTNYPYPQYRHRSLDLGADYFFEKSSDFDNLQTVFKELFSEKTTVENHEKG